MFEWSVVKIQLHIKFARVNSIENYTDYYFEVMQMQSDLRKFSRPFKLIIFQIEMMMVFWLVKLFIHANISTIWNSAKTPTNSMHACKFYMCENRLLFYLKFEMACMAISFEMVNMFFEISHNVISLSLLTYTKLNYGWNSDAECQNDVQLFKWIVDFSDVFYSNQWWICYITNSLPQCLYF